MSELSLPEADDALVVVRRLFTILKVIDVPIHFNIRTIDKLRTGAVVGFWAVSPDNKRMVLRYEKNGKTVTKEISDERMIRKICEAKGER